jgi:hypothetical protein
MGLAVAGEEDTEAGSADRRLPVSAGDHRRRRGGSLRALGDDQRLRWYLGKFRKFADAGAGGRGKQSLRQRSQKDSQEVEHAGSTRVATGLFRHRRKINAR